MIMQNKFFKFKFMTAIVAAFGLFFGSCSTDMMDDTEKMVSEKIENESLLKSGNSSQNKLLAQVRKATAKYHRIEAALADDYEEGLECVYVDGLGGMGYHFVNMGLVDPVFDPFVPEVLIYEPDADGKLHLVAVEYIIIDIGQDHPHFGNHPMDIGGTPVPVDHYSLHVWIWKENPNGMYTPFNPDVSCD
jgi:hypothetical protein